MTNQNKSLIAKETEFKVLMRDQYMNQIVNYLGSKQEGLRFLSGVVAAVQRNPKLLDCSPVSLMNSFMIMAQLHLMPSGVSGEAYVIPYGSEAQFQLGYQGLVTLFYRAGMKKVISEIIYEKDEFRYTNGEVYHNPDVFADDRGKPKGAYVIVELGTGGVVSKVMSAKEILHIGQTFSKSYTKAESPWNPKKDPQLWMWRKTVLKQVAKLVPKNEHLITAIAEDNKDSNIEDREAKDKETQEIKDALKLGAVETPNTTYEKPNTTSEESPEETSEEKADIEAFLDGKIDPKIAGGKSGDGKKNGLPA